MTPQEISNNTKYQAALARADAKGIGIVARYTDKSGAFLGCQVQGTEGKQYHVANENNRLTCDCPAASYGNYCMHRAIVTRAEMERAAQAAQVTRECESRYCHKQSVAFCPDCSEYHTFGDGGYFGDGAHYCAACLQDKCTHQPKSEPITARNDTGQRLFRGPASPVLPERVKEAW